MSQPQVAPLRASAQAAARAAEREATLTALVALESRVREARTPAELAFTIANETFQVAPYRQAFVWLNDYGGRARLQAVSGLAQLAEDSPLTLWLKRLQKWREPGEPAFLAAADVPEKLRAGWAEWLPALLLDWPIRAPDGHLLGRLWLALDEAPAEPQQEALAQAIEAYGYGLWALGKGRNRIRRGIARLKPLRWLVLAAAIGAMFIPVRMSVLAPAEVSAVDALIVAAPMEGVVKTFHVKPNEPVRAGQPLFTLDDTTIRNRREVAMQALAVARADSLKAQQKAFGDEASRAELAVLAGRVRERSAEVAYLDELLGRVEVRAPREGIAVFGDVNDWQGKPVVTGERIVLLADPKEPGVMVWLPVADAINLAPGAPIRMFLQTQPLEPLYATLTESSYQATLSPEGIASYRVRGRFEGDAAAIREQARIGLKGTAKVYGERAPLGYYLFRRPLASLRQWTGL